jgi:hypothetical protein
MLGGVFRSRIRPFDPQPYGVAWPGTLRVSAALVHVNNTNRNDPIVRPNEEKLFVYLNFATALIAALTVGLSYYLF